MTFKGLGEGKDGRNPPKIFKVEVDEDPQEENLGPGSLTDI